MATNNYVGYTEQSPCVLSICAGGLLGIERGFEAVCKRFNWKPPRTIAILEIEAFIVENLVKQMEQGVLDPTPIWTNVKTFDGKFLRGKVDFLFAGYPCQPFSHAGGRDGTEDPRHLFPSIEGIIEATRPICCGFENVGGHLSLGFPEVYASLRSLGYAVEAGLYTAEEVGAPHERERLFILAIRNDMVNPNGDGFAGCGTKTTGKDDQGGWPECAEVRGIGGTGETSGKLSEDKAGIEELEDTHDIRNGRGDHGDQGRDRRTDKVTGSGDEEELGNPSKSGLQKSGPGRFGEHAKEVGQGLDGGFEFTGDELANTNSEGYEGGKQPGAFGNRKSYESTSELNKGDVRWPSRPGERQYEWEEPRIESRVGFTIDGYNYREDLLRMAGNGIVWQQAEVAFADLFEKLLVSISKS